MLIPRDAPFEDLQTYRETSLFDSNKLPLFEPDRDGEWVFIHGVLAKRTECAKCSKPSKHSGFW